MIIGWSSDEMIDSTGCRQHVSRQKELASGHKTGLAMIASDRDLLADQMSVSPNIDIW
jgi:hypothetical protein